ncbi:hypothetical protein Hanom_Chr08g00730911 [Helianthus anomalus]
MVNLNFLKILNLNMLNLSFMSLIGMDYEVYKLPLLIFGAPATVTPFGFMIKFAY